MIPLALVLPRFSIPRTSGIWWAMATSISLQGVIMALAFNRGGWKRSRI
jgi:Na+-driven multidrug efflux pump